MIDIEQLLQYTSKLSLLYVEDDETIRGRNREVFIDFFHEVDLAKDGKEGIMKYLQYYHNTKKYYDIIITDIQMPKMNGITMSKLIREKYSDQMIIVLSAHKDTEYLFELINMGITYFLPKPTSIKTLYEMLFKTSKIVHDKNISHEYSKKLKTLNLELKRKVIEANLAKQQAQEATKFKDRFLANMSHEIRTPMNAIIGMSHILLQSPLQEKQKNNILKIENSANMLLQIINDILDFSKIEAGKLELEPIEFDINSVMEHLNTIINVKVMHKNINVSYNIDKNVSQYFIGDPIRLGQILLNLVDNAVKFTDQWKIMR